MPAAALAHCFEQAGQRYGVPPALLRAIAVVESAGSAAAVNRSHESRTSSRDLGLMQINSRWLPQLAPFGIDEAVLLGDACTNVHVGAWVLSQLFARYGAGWEAVGAYNAACTSLKGEACARARRAYAWRVYRALAGAG
jgi:soluble lytic murein transglycosylase-like protein